MDFKPLILQDIVEESEDVRTFKVSRPDGSVPSYQPGHFFLLRLPDEDGKPFFRSYSVASVPEDGTLWFCIKRKGRFPEAIWKLGKGDSLEGDGPYGVFLLRADDAERVFIGGGVGIAPLRSMILQTVKKDGKAAHLFHSSHTFAGLTYFSEMKKLAAENPLFKFYPSISGEEKPDGWSGYSERISVPLIKQTLGSLSGKTFYLCGSKEMAGSLAAALIAEGVPKERVKKDEWG